MRDVLKKFGRYFLLDQIAQGGMAEIYRARLAAKDGAGRIIVIKRIQAGHGTNSEFLEMFRSEIKVTMGFNHPNIVQLYDFGEEQGQPYIAMEMVDGKNLKQLITRFTEAQQPFPIELAAHIIEQAASGLHYAHSFKDKITGVPLSIVHRDISPQNIIVSYEGNVKVIDFGIAKATVNSEATRAGVIKGKPSYLSPEQINGDTLDGRCDIFALGAVFWELLTGKKLFAGENDLAVLKLIESCTTYVKGPSTLNTRVPKELDYIVLKCLTKQREKRFQTAEEVQRALHKFLYAYAPDFDPSNLAYFAKDLFKDEIVDDRKRIQKLNDKVEQLLSSEVVLPSTNFGVPPLETTTPPEESTTVMRPRTPDLEVVAAPQAQKLEVDDSSAQIRRPSRGTWEQAKVRRSTLSVPQPEPRAPKQAIGPVETKSGSGSKFAIAVVAAVALVSVFGDSFGIHVPYLSDLVGGMTDPKTGTLILKGDQKEVTVTVNGRVVAHSLPATVGEIPIGASLQVIVSSAQGSFHDEISFYKAEKKVLPVVLSVDRAIGSTPTGSAIASGEVAPTVLSAPEGARTVILHLNIVPGGGSPHITVMGQNVSSDNPTLIVPIDTGLPLTVERSGFRTFHEEFVVKSQDITAGQKEISKEVILNPTNFGKLTLHVFPSADATIMMDGKPWVVHAPFEELVLPVGDYSIRLVNDTVGLEKTVNVHIDQDKLVVLDDVRLQPKN